MLDEVIAGINTIRLKLQERAKTHKLLREEELREELSKLDSMCYREFADRDEEYLCDLANELKIKVQTGLIANPVMIGGKLHYPVPLERGEELIKLSKFLHTVLMEYMEKKKQNGST